MSNDSPRQRAPHYSQIDVSQNTYPAAGQPPRSEGAEQTRLLSELLTAQDRHNELLEELINQLGAAQRQRATELGQWREANPQLARSCRTAAETLGRIQTEYLQGMIREINENYEALLDGDFMLAEFVDRYGPRLAHLNGLVQVLAQLSAVPNPANSQNLQ